MKEHYSIEISDIQLTIVSDEPEDFVNSTVAKINDRVNDLIVRNKRCSKLDAALLCALDYCGELAKAERRIRNLEAQISLYDANLKRMREEIAAKSDSPDALRSALGVADSEKAAEAAADDKAADDKAKEEAAAPKSDKADKAKAAAQDDMVSMLDAVADSGDEAPKSDPDKSASSKAKLEQIEMLLRKSNG